MTNSKKKKSIKNLNVLPPRNVKVSQLRLPAETQRWEGEGGARQEFPCKDQGRVKQIAHVLGQMLSGLRSLNK